ncbi:hypothetical protein [Lentilactobacillus sp. SPB1-3]|uniref:Uncharacterized protein n=1 Tax=Lentilactobacillus terminaliae TaxID=3003483 RepID=A0ACD5DDU1_9LACO|nr:hypothetical protein [Lentilactobacillus sp. SPB1-3]MCZ0977453.1 hypothetical protein [Lentilactobacillus sp. SPB1-3]
MKKVILWGTIVLGMFGILMTSNATANASTWHIGVPTFLKSGFWKMNRPKNSYIKFSNGGIYSIAKEYNTDGFYCGVIANTRYKKTGKNYVIDYMISKKTPITSTIRRISKNKSTIYTHSKNDGFATHITRVTKLP